MDYTYPDISKMINHALLKPYLSMDDLEEGIFMAMDYEVAGVCILPYFLEELTIMLVGTDIVPISTIAFPHGSIPTVSKISETLKVAEDGAKELELMINVSRAVTEDWYGVGEDIHAVVNIAKDRGVTAKIIFETALLTDEQKITLCNLCVDLGVQWIKTSTGFGAQGATPEDIKLIKEHTPDSMKIEASGNIRTLDDVLLYRSLGCERVSTFETQKILDECKGRLGIE